MDGGAYETQLMQSVLMLIPKPLASVLVLSSISSPGQHWLTLMRSSFTQYRTLAAVSTIIRDFDYKNEHARRSMFKDDASKENLHNGNADQRSGNPCCV